MLCYLLLSPLYILHPSTGMLNVEAAVSCCSGLIEMVYNVSTHPFQRAFSSSISQFYSLIPAALMPPDLSEESLGELTS